MKGRRELILSIVQHLAGTLLYYDRKDDNDLPVGGIEEAVAAGEISWQEITEAFAAELPK